MKIISQLRALLRAFVFLSALLSYFICALLLYPYYKIDPMKGRRLICRLLQFYASFASWFMGIKVIEKGKKSGKGENFLIVSNHLSYTDILVICSRYPACFVTSVEMKNTPVLGQICELAGCVFVERRNKTNLSLEIKEITDALSSGLDVVIFPEATSTNGEEVIRFRRPLFQASCDSKKRIRTMSVSYKFIEDEPVTLKNRDTVCWYGDMTFPDHLWNLFSKKSVTAHLSHGDFIDPSDVSEHGELAEKSHHIVSALYDPIKDYTV